jgi:anthranilate synthase/aminodeoxychorismate synthase-like glutamine amidotransferase
MKRVVVIDNYDSFTYNLVQYLLALGCECDVRLNDKTTSAEVAAAAPDGILLSPGPGTPDDAGVTLDVIEKLGGKVPILGVCLGHQSIGQAYGGRVIRAPRLMHGKTSLSEHDGKALYANVPSPFEATRYPAAMSPPTSVPNSRKVPLSSRYSSRARASSLPLPRCLASRSSPPIDRER